MGFAFGEFETALFRDSKLEIQIKRIIKLELSKSKKFSDFENSKLCTFWGNRNSQSPRNFRVLRIRKFTLFRDLKRPKAK